MVEPGQVAPDFSLLNETGTEVRLSGFRGKHVVLYFYPKDDTPGCTLEAQGFTQKKAEFDAKNTVVLGISKDSVASHQAFCTKYSLGITLLSDPEMVAIEPYGVWQEKTNYGKTYMGISRSTVLIDPEGTVQKVWRNVKVDGHVDAVLKAI